MNKDRYAHLAWHRVKNKILILRHGVKRITVFLKRKQFN